MEQSPSRSRPIRLPVLYLFVAIGLVGAVAEVVLLPYLVTTPLYLALTLATTIVVATSIGLTRSGVRRELPRSLRTGTTLLMAALSLTTIFVLVVLPYLGSSGARHDKAVSFAAPSADPTTSSPVATTAAVATPLAVPAVLTGAFNHTPGPDSVSGTATLGKAEYGANVLRLAGLDATPGPDLYLYLSRSENPSGPQATAGLQVSQLKTYKGDFTFTLDPALDLSQFKSVVVYCRSFNVVFGYANLR